MTRSTTSLPSLTFSLYLKPSLLIISFYQIIVTGIYTSQQLLLAAYLDESGYILISGIILAVFFVFMFTLGPICATLSDRHGRKALMVAANWFSIIGFIGLFLVEDPLSLFFMNAIVGIGTSLRVGSVVALWVQHSPENRVGESLAYFNIIFGLGGVVGALLGFIMWLNIGKLTFLFFGILLFISAIPILFLSDKGEYLPFSYDSTLNVIKDSIYSLRTKKRNHFFLSKPMIQVSIHWLAFSTIIAFTTFIIPILERIIEQIPIGSEIPLPVFLIILLAFIISGLSGLIIWGKISDFWERKPVLIIGFSGCTILILLCFSLFQFELLLPIIEGLASVEIFSLTTIGIFLVLIFTGVALIPTPMAWISDLVGQEDLAKAMSLRQALIGMGTVLGALIGGYTIGIFGLSGLFLIILFFLIVSAIILI